MEAKKLHPMVAAQIKLILERNDIRIERKATPGIDTYKVFDSTGKELLSYINGWDYGMYTIRALGKVAANIEWRENDTKTTPEQKAVFEIFDLIRKKMNDSNLEQNMSEEDRNMMNALKEYAAESKKVR